MITKTLSIMIVLSAALLLGGCLPEARVGALQSESRSVEVGNAKSVRVEIQFGAGDLKVTGGAEKLLEADFAYNVANIKPVVKYTNGNLLVQQSDTFRLALWPDISDYRNEWSLRLSDKVPMDLKVNAGAGSSDLQLAGLSLTGLDVTLGIGTYTLDLSGDWPRNLSVRIDPGAANVSVHLPRRVGARVTIDEGPHRIEATGLVQHGDIYTNDAYGVSGVTMQVDIKGGPGEIDLDVERAAVAPNNSPVAERSLR